jgi:hypothetical protein
MLWLLRPAVAPILLVLALGGCKLIDQRTFQRTPPKPDAATMARAWVPAPPLATIRLANPSADWRAGLDAAVRAAQARKPDVRFRVMTPIPTSATRTIQAQYLKVGEADAQMIARALVEDGVPPGRIMLGFVGDPGTPTREVRLYVE